MDDSSIFSFLIILILISVCFFLIKRGQKTKYDEHKNEDKFKKRNLKDKEIALKEEKEKKAKRLKDLENYEIDKEKKAKLEKELELINSVYTEKEIEHQKYIQEQNKIKQKEDKKVEQRRIEELRKLNFEEVKEKKEKLEKEIGISDKVSNKNILNKEEVKEKKNYTNNVDILSITNFENKIKNAIPFHQLSSPPPIGNIEGSIFECGCGSKHKMQFNKHLYLADMGMLKAVFLSIDCEYINALKYKSMFSNDIENLFSTRWLKNKNKFGFTKSDMMLSQAI